MRNVFELFDTEIAPGLLDLPKPDALLYHNEALASIGDKYIYTKSICKALAEPYAKIKFVKTASAYTDGDTVFIGTGFYDNLIESGWTEDSALTFLISVTVHELCHVHYTDFSMATQYFSILEKNKRVPKIVKYIENTIEDARIEKQYIKDEKESYRLMPFLTSQRVTTTSLEKKPIIDEQEHFIEQNLSAVFRICRLVNVDTEPTIKDSEVFEDLYDLLQDFPKDFTEVLITTTMVYEIINAKFKEKFHESIWDYLNNRSKGFDAIPIPNEGSMEDESASKAEEEDVDEGRPNHVTLNKESSFGPAPFAEIEGLYKAVTAGVPEDQKTTPKIELRRPKGSKAKYVELKKEVSVRAKVLEKLLRSYLHVEREHSYSTSGKLSSKKYSAYKAGSKTLYKRTFERKSMGGKFLIVVDESGSMYGDKIRYTRLAATLIQEAFKNVPNVETMFVGHTADYELFDGSHDYSSSRRDVVLRVFKEFEQKESVALSDIEALSNNSDAYALMAASKLVRAKTKDPVTIIYISDGAPAATTVVDPILDLKMCVGMLEKDNFDVISVAIESSIPQEGIFKKYVKFTELKDLPKQLSNLIKGSLKEV